jgi:ubiquinone/menaquinone biosynthesis C-methylase UbiE
MTAVSALLGAAALFLLIVLLWPVKVPRRYGLEGAETAESVRAYDRTSRWPVFAIERWLIMRELQVLKPHGRLVDVGCGPGYLARGIAARLPQLAVLGLDIDPRALALARGYRGRTPPAGWLAADAQQLPFADGSLDVVVSSLSLHHWNNVPAALREFYRVLRPGGKLLIWDLRRNAPHFFYYGLAVGQRLFSPRGIKETNGAVGSFWSSYTPAELREIVATIPFRESKVGTGVGWLSLRASKPKPT